MGTAMAIAQGPSQRFYADAFHRFSRAPHREYLLLHARAFHIFHRRRHFHLAI